MRNDEVTWTITGVTPEKVREPFPSFRLGLRNGETLGDRTLDIGELALVRRMLDSPHRYQELAGRTFTAPAKAAEPAQALDLLIERAKARLSSAKPMWIDQVVLHNVAPVLEGRRGEFVAFEIWILPSSRHDHVHLRGLEVVAVTEWPLVEPYTGSTLNAAWVYSASTGAELASFLTQSTASRAPAWSTATALGRLVETGRLPGCSPISGFELEVAPNGSLT